MDRIGALQELIKHCSHAELIICSECFDVEKYHDKEALYTLMNDAGLRVVINTLPDDWMEITISIKD